MESACLVPTAATRGSATDTENVDTLFDENATTPLATFNPTQISEQSATGHDKTPAAYTPTESFRFLYTPDDRDFVYIVEGMGVKEHSADDGRS